MAEGTAILAVGALLAAGLAASLLAGRLRLPGLVLFLGLGMAVGSDGLGWIDFDDYEAARTVGIVALALILFEGGLTAGYGEIRPVLGAALSLATVGTVVTAGITGLAATLLFDLTTEEGLLVGAILASTDGAAIFALLRGSTLQRRLARTLEGESGFNDPVAVLLVLGLIETITDPSFGAAGWVELLLRQLGLGLVVGLVVGRLAVTAFQRMQLSTGGLYPVASLAAAALAFGGADVLHGSGFLAVYLTGLALGSAPIPAQQTVTSFHQGLGWVAQLSMFVTLGLLVFPSDLDEVAVEGAVLGLIVVLVARPVATFAALGPAGWGARDQIVLGWAGLRGAVPVVLATFPVIEGVPGSVEFFNIVFFAVLISTLLQGTSFEGVAARLGRTTDEPALPRPLAESGTIRRLGAEMLEFGVAPEDSIVGVAVRDIGLPREAVVNVIVREGQAIPPRGSTRIQAGDHLHVLYREEAAKLVGSLVTRWRTGEVGPVVRPRPVQRSSAPVLSIRPWEPAWGDATRPQEVLGLEVIDTLRIRRDAPGSLVVLADGRYAICGALLAVGGRRGLLGWGQRRMAAAGEEERAWLRTALGALAAEGQPPQATNRT